MAEAAADEVDGTVQTVDAPECPRQKVIVLAAPGHYTIIPEADELLLWRLEGGGYAVAAVTPRTSGQEAWPGGGRQVRDTGILGRKADGTWGAHLRIRGDEVEIISASKISLDGAVPVALHEDPVVPDTAFTKHTHSHVCVVTGATVPHTAALFNPATDPHVGKVNARGTKVTAGT